MVMYCCAWNCTESYVKGGKITFHSFPANEERRKEWVRNVRRENFVPSKHTKICSKHFTEDSFDREKFGGHWLKATAVPTLFDFPHHLLCKEKKRKSPLKRKCSEENVEPVFSSVPHSCDPGPSAVVSEVVSFPLNEDSRLTTPLKPSKKYRYVGDFTEEDMNSPTKARKVLLLAQQNSERKRKQVKQLHLQASRLKRQVASLKEVLAELKKNSLISDGAGDILEMSLPGPAAELLKRSENGQGKTAYSPDLRAFALTLHFYSPRAYNYVRKSFNSALPHPSTLRKWCSSLKTSVGFSKEVLPTLKALAERGKEQQTPIYCALSVDEMAIRQHIEWDGSKFAGYVDFGTGLDDDNLPVAKEALTLMLTAINGRWKVPIGYFFINGLHSIERANLVRQALDFIGETGVEVCCITFDGLSSNVGMVSSLGANLCPESMAPFFMHGGKKVYTLLDPCHMLKLVRNALATERVLVDGEGRHIKWQLIEELEKFQREQGLHAGTKLRKQHIEWYREKMKVRLAAQTLSRSVASAIRYLGCELKHPQFDGCEATIEFIEKFNDLFDILNSRNLLSGGYKAPIKDNNLGDRIDFLSKASGYISTLKKCDGVRVIDSKRRTGFIGFLVASSCVTGLSQDLIGSGKLKFLMTYKLSQDHVETFFSMIRSKGGFNNNPTVNQFSAAYKKILLHKDLSLTQNGNCIPQDKTSVLTISSNIPSNNPHIPQPNFPEWETTSHEVLPSTHIEEHNYSMLSQTKAVSAYVGDVVGYVAGFVMRKLENKVKCEECLNALETESSGEVSRLLLVKNRGGLKVPSKSVVTICKVVENVYRRYQACSQITRINILRYLERDSLVEVWERGGNLFPGLQDHIYDNTPTDNHRNMLIKAIIYQYASIRLYHTGKIATQELRRKNTRSINTKTVLFMGH